MQNSRPSDDYKDIDTGKGMGHPVQSDDSDEDDEDVSDDEDDDSELDEIGESGGDMHLDGSTGRVETVWLLLVEMSDSFFQLFSKLGLLFELTGVYTEANPAAPEPRPPANSAATAIWSIGATGARSSRA